VQIETLKKRKMLARRQKETFKLHAIAAEIGGALYGWVHFDIVVNQLK
jgi:hypothetical protein